MTSTFGFESDSDRIERLRQKAAEECRKIITRDNEVRERHADTIRWSDPMIKEILDDLRATTGLPGGVMMKPWLWPVEWTIMEYWTKTRLGRGSSQPTDSGYREYVSVILTEVPQQHNAGEISVMTHELTQHRLSSENVDMLVKVLGACTGMPTKFKGLRRY